MGLIIMVSSEKLYDNNHYVILLFTNKACFIDGLCSVHQRMYATET